MPLYKMIYVYIKNELKPFENDIRELCMAFFVLQKINFIYDSSGENVSDNSPSEVCEPQTLTIDNSINVDNDIIIKDFYDGSFDKSRYELKGEIKRQLYMYLNELTGKKLRWGTLTGIRPVNIVTKILEAGSQGSSTPKERKISDVMGLGAITEIEHPIYKENELIKKYLKDEYYISDEKAFEIIKIARKEIEILNRPEIKNYKDSFSVYVGVPFCKSTCLYCSFSSYNIDKFGKYVDKYLETLEGEFKRACEDRGSKLKPMSIYIGGGTPTSLDEEHFEKLLTMIDKYIDIKNSVEFTVEAGRPDTITEEKLVLMKKFGVTRISINPQSFNQKTLDLIGRKHSVKDVKEKFRLARKLGFDNINMDIILGLPNEHLLDVLKTLNEIRKLKPDSLTVHSLALKRAARLNYELEEWTKNYYLAGVGSRGEIDKMFKWSERLAEHLNLKPYYLYRQKNMAGNLENVGYAKVGKECIYNIMMMSERHTVLGFGTATTKKITYNGDEKIIDSEEGYKSVIDYCERSGLASYRPVKSC